MHILPDDETYNRNKQRNRSQRADTHCDDIIDKHGDDLCGQAIGIR